MMKRQKQNPPNLTAAVFRRVPKSYKQNPIIAVLVARVADRTSRSESEVVDACILRSLEAVATLEPAERELLTEAARLEQDANALAEKIRRMQKRP